MHTYKDASFFRMQGDIGRHLFVGTGQALASEMLLLSTVRHAVAEWRILPGRR